MHEKPVLGMQIQDHYPLNKQKGYNKNIWKDKYTEYLKGYKIRESQ